jgi:RNA polymerase sigma factor (sigma-70 family)
MNSNGPAAPAAPFSQVTDADALAQIARGQREMFEVIVRRYNQQLYRVGMAYLHDHGQVEDAMQNAYVKAFLKLPTYERTAAFSTWLTRIMINECLMILRRRRSRPEAPLPVSGSESGAPGTVVHHDFSPDPVNALAAAEHHEMSTLLESAVAALPRKYRTVYMLREVQQLSTAEVAGALKISEASVKVDLHRARERLKAELLKSASAAELFAYRACYCDPMTAQVMQRVLVL